MAKKVKVDMKSGCERWQVGMATLGGCDLNRGGCKRTIDFGVMSGKLLF